MVRRNRYRCGLLNLRGDGQLKKVPLSDGGGSRTCDWYSASMNFNAVHQQLLKVYKLENERARTSLYDFRQHPLRRDVYIKLSHYMNDHGLTGHGISLYLCYHENGLPTITAPPEVIPSIPSPSPSVEILDVSTRSFESIDDHRKTFLENEYSYNDEIETLVDDVRSLLQRIHFHPILFQLFENICRISSAIDLYTELFRESSEALSDSQKSCLVKKLADLAERCQSSINLWQSNEQTFTHLPEYREIKNKLLRFDSFCQALRREETTGEESSTATSEIHPEEPDRVKIEYNSFATSLTRLFQLFQEYHLTLNAINRDLVKQANEQASPLNPRFLAHVQYLIKSVRKRFMRMFSRKDLDRSVYQTITELFDSISVNLEYLLSQCRE